MSEFSVESDQHKTNWEKYSGSAQSVFREAQPNSLRIHLLGSPYAVLPDGEVVDFLVDNTLLLMAYLAFHPGKAFRRAELTSLFYPDHDDLHANQNMRQVIYRLRKLLKDDTRKVPGLLVNSLSIRINPNGPLLTDVQLFNDHERTTRQFIQQHSHRRLEICRTCITQLEELANLYTGSLLDGFYPHTNGPLDEIIPRFRQGLQDKYIWTLNKLANYHFEHQQYEQGAVYAGRILDFDPLDEAAVRMAMKISAITGHRNLALMCYRNFQRNLQANLDVMPEDETFQLAQAIRSGKYSLNQTLSVTKNQLPITYQEVSGALLPDITLPFYGRSREIGQILDLLESQEERVIAIKGVIGSGKTRFALHAAALDKSAWANGVYMVLLNRDLPSRTSLVSTMVQALGVQSNNSSEHRKNLVNFLKNRESLIIIDNLDEIPDQAEVVQALVALCPKIKFIVTTRKHLGIRGEKTVYFNGLDYPSLQNAPTHFDQIDQEAFIQQYPALQLFQDIAVRAKSDFVIDASNIHDIIQICEMLIGLPLGIELTASYVRLFTCAEIREGIHACLTGVDSTYSFIASRQGNLKRRFAYVWDSLTPAERDLVKAVYPYTNGVSTDDLLESDLTTMETLVTLQDKSTLIKVPDSKVKLHPLVRFYISQ